MAHRRPARLVAPLALVAAVVATIVVALASVSASDSKGGTPAATSTASGTTAKHGASASSGKSHHRRTYTVKPGDILSTVSERTGVSITRIEELNPDLDAQALQVGQKIRLEPAAGSP